MRLLGTRESLAMHLDLGLGAALQLGNSRFHCSSIASTFVLRPMGICHRTAECISEKVCSGQENEGIILSMPVIHISETEAARDFAGLLARVRAGDEIVIEKEASPSVVLRRAFELRGRLLSESIALAETHAKEMGFEPVMDPEYAVDMEEIIRNCKVRDISAWD